MPTRLEYFPERGEAEGLQEAAEPALRAPESRVVAERAETGGPIAEIGLLRIQRSQQAKPASTANRLERGFDIPGAELAGGLVVFLITQDFTRSTIVAVNRTQ